MRKISRKALIKKLDKLVSEIIIKRDKCCVICGSTSNLNNGHVFSRTHQATRWDINLDGNCHCQCYPCNFKHVHNTYPYNNWYVKKFSEKNFDNLYQRWNVVTHLKTSDLLWMYEDLKKIYDKTN
jgi:hypothetical protein